MTRPLTTALATLGICLLSSAAMAQSQMPAPPVPGPYPLMPTPMTMRPFTPMAPVAPGAMPRPSMGQNGAAQQQYQAQAPSMMRPNPAMAMAVPYWMQAPAGVSTAARGVQPAQGQSAGVQTGNGSGAGRVTTTAEQPQYPTASTAQVGITQPGPGLVMPGFGQVASPGFFPTYNAVPYAPNSGFGSGPGAFGAQGMQGAQGAQGAQPSRFGAPSYVPQPYANGPRGPMTNGGALR